MFFLDKRSNALKRQMSNYQHIVIYTDGACKNNGKSNARAGYGAVMYYYDTTTQNITRVPESKPLYGRIHEQPTNQRSELIAVIKALEAMLSPSTDFWPFNYLPSYITILTDSRYTVNGINEWMPNWINKNFQVKVKNLDLFLTLYQLINVYSNAGGMFNIQYVEGHNGIAGNEEADRLANMGIALP